MEQKKTDDSSKVPGVEGDFIRTSKWPKKIPVLSPERQAIRDDFMRSHLEAMQTKWYGVIGRFDHKFAVKSFFPGAKTLEIGAGIGEHLNWERYQEQEYHVVELREELCERLKSLYPGVNAIARDCQVRMPFEDGYFDRILAIHVLEHLPDLPSALGEIRRLLKDTGVFSVVIPCEGAWAYSLARNISARPHFEKKYHDSYDWFVQVEHISRPEEIIEELEKLFNVKAKRFYPLFIPVINFNLTIGLTLTKKNDLGVEAD
jgi:SAM-dependent methyltransferase